MSTCVRTCRAATWEVTSLYRGRRAGDEGGPFSTCHPRRPRGRFAEGACVTSPAVPSVRRGCAGGFCVAPPTRGGADSETPTGT